MSKLRKEIEKEKKVLKEEVFVKEKKFGFRRFQDSFTNSFHGLFHAFLNEQSLSLIAFATICLIPLGFIVKLNKIEWIFVILHLGLLAVTELLNTAIEAVVDKASPEINPLAKISKDTASGAEFIMFLVSFINLCLIYIPKMLLWFK